MLKKEHEIPELAVVRKIILPAIDDCQPQGGMKGDREIDESKLQQNHHRE